MARPSGKFKSALVLKQEIMAAVSCMTFRDAVQRLDTLLDGLSARVVELRHFLHRHPELSMQEFQTTQHLADLMRDHGMEPSIPASQRGLIVNLSNQESHTHRLALRADIDALPIQDAKTDRPYCSQVKQVMHACGHDVHASALWGALTALHRLLGETPLAFPCNWRFIFQPAEEVAQGAKEMIGFGALDGVESIYCVHVEPTLPAGTLGIKSGKLMAACDLVEFTIRGQGAHGARPHQSRDPIAAALQLGQSLYALCPRAVDSREASVLSLCQIHGGSGNNVIPMEAKMGGTLRTLSADTRATLIEKIKSIAKAVAISTETEIDVAISGAVPELRNDEKLIEIAKPAARRAVGESNLRGLELPSMGGEDFAFYLDHIPGALIRVGSASDDVGDSPLHTPTFDVDNAGLLAAMRFFAHLALEWSYVRSCVTQPAAVG